MKVDADKILRILKLLLLEVKWVCFVECAFVKNWYVDVLATERKRFGSTADVRLDQALEAKYGKSTPWEVDDTSLDSVECKKKKLWNEGRQFEFPVVKGI